MRNYFRLPSRFVIPAILISGFGFRLIGINIGLPDSPDPREVLIARDVLNLIHFTAPPEIYNWPGTAWFYVIAGIGKLLSLAGLQLTEARVILLARCINVLLSIATLWFTYRIGIHCYNKRIGQIAAGLLAVAMLHATNESRFALVDIPATFCVTLFLWIVIRARSSSAEARHHDGTCQQTSEVAPTFQTAVWLGVILGTGFAVKFTTVFVGLSLLVFPISGGFYKKFATIIGVSALTFTLLCPYWLIDLISPEWNLFFEDFWYEATHYHRGHFGLIAAAESGLLHRFTHLWMLLKWGMGLPLALLVSLGILWALVRLKRAVGGFPISEVLLLTFVIPYLLFIGIHKVKFARHLLILYPALTVLAAAAFTRIPSIVATLLARGCRRETVNLLRSIEGFNTFGKWFGTVLGGVVALYSLVYTLSFASILLSQPTKIAASDWIAAHIPPEESVAVAPEILFDWLLPDLDFIVTDEKVKWVLIVVPDLEVFQKYQASPHRYQDEDWYPLSEIEFEETLAFYTRVLGDGSPYQLSKTFRCPPKFLGSPIISDSGAPFPMRALAHPELRVYRRLDATVP
ncbi:MAG: glycosyltransferase family 39 protein [Candidatus Poribacteria bacterium]|nr:glycosyltransferase family 39 protein [Candidatus Poribacteria bacterium]